MLQLRFSLLIFLFVALFSCKNSISIPAEAEMTAEEKAKEMLSRLTLEQKISLLGYQSPGIDSLGINVYNWWNEALHGVARNGEATIFPQAIAMAASFNPSLMREVSEAISTEARAKFNINQTMGHAGMYQGLTFWSPNINIFRDPRWGRGQETYGEDPFLTGEMGAAFVKGLQSQTGGHLKTAACAKHFAVHSGPEADRHSFDALVDEKDMRETYLYAFKKLADAKVEAVMCAYNRINGEPCCTSEGLLQRILRDEWGFQGHIVTDCGALYNVYQNHHTAADGPEAAAQAIRAGVSVDCSDVIQKNAREAVNRGLVSESDIDAVLLRSLTTRFKLGLDENTDVYGHYGEDSVANDYHRQLAYQMAVESSVLLYNPKQILPLQADQFQSIMVLGPNACSADVLMGNYHGVSSKATNFLEGIVQVVGQKARIEYDMGCEFKDTSRFGGIWAAGNAEVSLVFLGLSPLYEGENGDAFLSEHGADKADLMIPAGHFAFLKKLRSQTKTPIILVLTGGSAVDVSALEPYADAILMSWYPGQEGGKAIADIIFGKADPSGRLPVTFYDKLSDLPDYADYSMADRTYRYFNGPVRYPFGFGLSYTDFSMEWKEKASIQDDKVQLKVKLTNTGAKSGRQVVQIYFAYPQVPRMPVRELKAFAKSAVLQAGESQDLVFSIPVSELQKWDLDAAKWMLYPGKYTVYAGSHALDMQLSQEIEL